jgi:S-adenosylmethionine decarboxylase
MFLKGLHIIASIKTNQAKSLMDAQSIKKLIDQQIIAHQLQKLGEVYYTFDSGGYTAVVCLSESHISLHTWPEHQLVNLDIYLSNHLRNNENIVEQIFEHLQNYFDGEIIAQNRLYR